jgi:hypothetical protein
LIIRYIGVGDGRRDGIERRTTAAQQRIVTPEHDALEPPIAGHQFEIRGQERPVILAALGVHQQMDRGDIALAAAPPR